MDAVILAAGMATRLRPLTTKTPKCLLNIGNKPIIWYIINNLLKNNINNFIIVTGFMESKIKNYINKKFPDLNVRFITNDKFEITNNAYSLLLTKNYVKSDFILLDSDIFFHYQIINLLLTYNKEGIKLAVKKYKLSDEEIKVDVTEDKQILNIGKWLDINKAYGESIGIEYFPENYVHTLFVTLEKRIINENRINEFYEASFQEMIENQIKFYAVDVNDLFAIEIDFVDDLKKAFNIYKKNLLV